MKYYYLIAGLPDLQPDNIKTAPTITALLEELDAALTPHDRVLRLCVAVRHDICWLTRIRSDLFARQLLIVGKFYLKGRNGTSKR